MTDKLTDLHNRKPLVLLIHAALQWLDSNINEDSAYQLLLAEHEPASQFEWFPVGRDIGNVRNQGPQLIERVG